MVSPYRRLCAAIFCVAFLISSQAAWAQSVLQPVNLDLTSTNRTLAPPQALQTAPVSINVGGAVRSISEGSALTPGERLAVYQVLSTGQQSVLLGLAGNAVGGSFNFGPNFGRYVSSVVVPQNVNAILDAAIAKSVNLTGDLTNAGVLRVLSTNSGVTSASIAAANVYNQMGASISSSIDLTISALGNIVNSGTISSTKSLTLNSGGSVINALPQGASGAAPVMQALQSININAAELVNHGVISAVTGNLNIASEQTLKINNTSGVLQAISAAINVSSKDQFGVVANGGDWLSRELNFNAACGSVNAKLNEVTGTVNVHGSAAHLQANTANLTLGMIDLTGDPTFYNNGGSVNLGTTSVTGDLAIVAAQDVIVSGNLSSAPGDGQNGHMTLIAGAQFVPPPAISDSQVGPDIATNLQISGGSATGGAVSVSGTITTNGGNLVVAAYNGNGTGSSLQPGTIDLTGDINTGLTSVTRTNGNVTIISGATSGTGISTGSITTSGSSSNGNGGSITLLTAAPVISGGGNLTIINGTTTPSIPFATTGLTISNAGISAGNLLSAGAGGAGVTSSIGGNGGDGGDINIQSGGALSTGYIRAFGGGGGGGSGGTGSGGGAGGSGASITINSATGAINISGDVNASGGGGGGSGNSLGAAGGNAGSINIVSSGSLAISGPVLASGGGVGGNQIPGESSFSSTGGGGSFGGGGGASTSRGPGGGGGGGGFTGGGGAGGRGFSNSGGGGGGGFSSGGGGGGGAGGPDTGNGPAGGGGGGGGGLGVGGGGGGGGDSFGNPGGGGSGGAGGEDGASALAESGTGSGGAGGISIGGGGAGASGQDGEDGDGGRGGNGGGAGTGSGSGGSGAIGTGGNGGTFGRGGGSGSPSTGTPGFDVGTGGSGGAISLTGQTVSVTGTIGAASGAWPGFPSTPYSGESIDARGTGGSVTITSRGGSLASTVYSTNANYGSGATTSPAPTITAGNTFTSAGTLNAGSSITISGVSQGTSAAAGSYAGFAQISLAEGSNTVVVSTGNPVTPAELVALVQASGGASQSLVLSQSTSGTTPGFGFASGGNFTVATANLPVGDFINLVLPAGVTMNASVATLNYSGIASIGGVINFTAATNNLLIAGSNIFGSGSVTGANGGVFITSTNGSIGLTGDTLSVTTSGFNILLNANEDINVGAISSFGAAGSGIGAAGQAGGNINISSAHSVSTGTLRSYGGGGSGGGVGSIDGGAGGTGGNISVSASAGILTISGDVNASGGGGGGGSGGGDFGTPGLGGTGGSAGSINLNAGGSVSVSGDILAVAGGAGGDGGTGVGGPGGGGGGGGGGGSYGGGGLGGLSGSPGSPIGNGANANGSSGGAGGFPGPGPEPGSAGNDAGGHSGAGSIFIVSGDTISLNPAKALNGGATTLASVGTLSVAQNITTPGYPITLVSSLDILAAGNGTFIDSSDATGGGAIFIVAGASFTLNGATLTINGASSPGGSINFDVSPTVNVAEIDSQGLANDSAGADINLIAYSGSGGGSVNFLPNSAICTCGDGSGNNGNLNIFAGASSGTTINLPFIDTAMGTGSGGAITVATAQPQFSDGDPITFDINGNITTGNSFQASSTTKLASMLVPSAVLAAGAVSLTAGSGMGIRGMITVENGAPINIQASNLFLDFGNDETAIQATGPSSITIGSGFSAVDVDLRILASHSNIKIQTTGGDFIRISPTGKGKLTFNPIVTPPAGLSFEGALLDIALIGDLEISSGFTVKSDNSIFINMNNSVGTQKFTLNGTLSSTANGGTILIQNLISNFNMAGTGVIEQLGSTGGDVVFNDFTRITFFGGTNLQLNATNPGGSVRFFTPELRVAQEPLALPGPVSATLAATNIDGYVLSADLPCKVCRLTFITPESAGVLNLNGAPVSTGNTISPDPNGGPVTDISVLPGFTLRSDNSITLNTASGSILLNGGVETTGLTSTISVHSSNVLNIKQTAGTGFMSAPGGISFVADIPGIAFATTAAGISLTGDVQITSCPGFVSASTGSVINYSNDMTIETCVLNNPGAFHGGNPLVVNICPDCPAGGMNPGGGTIVNSGGNLVLTSGLVVNSNGKDVAIISSGSISATGAFTINLSSTTGNGGNLFILAGADIQPLTNGQVKDSSTAFGLNGLPSATGGSVYLGTVSINTSTSKVGATAGNVSIGAFSGPSNPGVVTIGGINASAPQGSGGRVLIAGQGGLQVIGSINTSSKFGGEDAGHVGLFTVAPDLGPGVAILNGNVFGEMNPGCGECGSTSQLLVMGSINTSATAGSAGNVILEADRLVTVQGSITTNGLSSGCGCGSGDVEVATNGGAFNITGSINMSGLGITSGTSSDPATSGGQLLLIGTAYVQIGGSIISKGGANNANGPGGDGGIVQLFGNPSVGPNEFAVGSFTVGGYIDLSGGNSKTDLGGMGGLLAVSIGRFWVGGVNGLNSINASAGTGVEPGSPGAVDIQTYSVQALPTVFDLTNKTKSEYAVPGGLFAIGDVAAVNGTRGNILIAGNGLANKTNAGRIVDTNSPFTNGNISINVTGGSYEVQQGTGSITIAPDNGTGVRTKVTPGQAVALFQLSRGDESTLQTVGLNDFGQVVDASPNGGGKSEFSADYFEFLSPVLFNKFNLATVQNNLVTMNVEGDSAYVNLSAASSINIAGTINFNNIFQSTLELGARQLNVAASGKIQQPGLDTLSSLLVLVGTAPTWNVFGTIQGSTISVWHPDTALTFAMGTTGKFSGREEITSDVFMQMPSLTMTGGEVTLMHLNVVSPLKPPGTINITSKFSETGALGNMMNFNTIKIAPTTGGLLVADTVTISANTSLILQAPGTIFMYPNAKLASNGSLSIISTGGDIVTGDNDKITAAKGTLTLQAVGINLAVSNLLQAGVLKTIAPPSGVLTAAQIQSSGNLVLTAGINGILVNNLTVLNSVGGNITAISNNGGAFDFSNDTRTQADGGNIYLVGSERLSGGSGNTFYARAVGTTGGGLELASGSNPTNQIAFAFTQPRNTTSPPNAQTLLGTNVSLSNTNGVLLLQPTCCSATNLSPAAEYPATLTLSRGVMVFQTSGTGTVLFSGGTFKTEALRPIAFYEPVAPTQDNLTHLTNGFINASEDFIIDSPFAQVEVKKGALLVVESERHTLRIFACSGPADIRLVISDRTITLSPGQEIVLSDRELQQDQIQPADGIGRRLTKTYRPDANTFAAVSDFSLVSLLSGSKHLSSLRQSESVTDRQLRHRMIKSAAVLHQVGASRGVYHAVMPPVW